MRLINWLQLTEANKSPLEPTWKPWKVHTNLYPREIKGNKVSSREF